MIPCSEVLFLDPLVDDAETLLHGLRPGVEAVVLDAERPAARQIAQALADRRDLGAIHIIAHGAPGQIGFAAGAWSAETLDEESYDLAAIGQALRPGGDLRLWSCFAGAGTAGGGFVDGLARATGASVAAPNGLIGSARLGGTWELGEGAGAPPLTEAATAA